MAEDLRDKDPSYWKDKLTPEEYHIAFEGGTEAAFTGELYDNHEDGMYRCKVCGEELFSSETKYDSGSGWPSFFNALDEDKVELRQDDSFGMIRTEVVCNNCGAHLGHVFGDAPSAGGKKYYCINSAVLDFESKE